MSNVGRPLKFKSVKALQKQVDAYFESCYVEQWELTDRGWMPVLDQNGEIMKRQMKPFTITGLASFLGTTRKTLLDYEEKDEFSNTIKNAKTRIEAFAEENLYTPKIAAGVIFNLKNNFGWEDKTAVQTSGETTHTIQHKQDLSRLSVKELKELESILAKTADAE